MRRAFLFDIDGTLLDTGGCGRRAYTRAFLDVFGVPRAFSGIPFSGQTDPGLLRMATRLRLGRDPAPEEEADFYARYLEHLEGELRVANSFRVYPGVRTVLHALATRPDCVVGLCTGNILGGARLKLARGGLDGLFPFGGYGSDDPDRAALTRIALERAKALAGADVIATVVGDSPLDAAAARANGLRVVLVATGWTPVEELAACSPDVLLESFEDWERALVALLDLPGPITASVAEEDRAATVVRSGGVVLHPTSGVYGIGGDAFDPKVADRLRRIKGGRSSPFLVLVGDTAAAFELAARAPEAARLLAEAFWPGPLTLVLDAARGLPEHLLGPGGTVAVRVDAHPFARTLSAARPITSSSANRTGAKPPASREDLDPAVVAACDMAVIEAMPLGGTASTLVGFDGETPRVLRQGAVPADEVLAAVSGGARQGRMQAPAGGAIGTGMAPDRH